MSSFKEVDFTLENYMVEHGRVLESLDYEQLAKAVGIVEDAFSRGVKIATCGNGGSATTASHFITDWNKMANLATGEKFRGLSLVDNIGLVTAYGNDQSFDEIFSGQCEAILDEGDLLIAISGSGNSRNVLRALETANELGASTLAILGYDGGQAIKMAGHAFLVPSFDMQVCEDIHLMFGHIVMKTLCGNAIRALV